MTHVPHHANGVAFATDLARESVRTQRLEGAASTTAADLAKQAATLLDWCVNKERTLRVKRDNVRIAAWNSAANSTKNAVRCAVSPEVRLAP